MRLLLGVDYGSKLAGTTAVCYLYSEGNAAFLSSRKGEDADKMLLDFVLKHGPANLFLDAPLSLPLAYFQGTAHGTDFFYRQCDRQLGAMSPMFLGGLTARAIKLSFELKNVGASVFETYPKWQALHST